jgi:hypothetical protein
MAVQGYEDHRGLGADDTDRWSTEAGLREIHG